VKHRCHNREDHILRFPRFGTLALVAGLALGLLSSPGLAQQDLPEPFAFPQGKDSSGPVTFDHTKHRAAGVDKCTACHVKVFKMEKGQSSPLTMEKMKAGQFCGSCHNGKTRVGSKVVFNVDDKANCVRCHKK